MAAHFLGLLNRLRSDIDLFIKEAEARLLRYRGNNYVRAGQLPKSYLEGKGALAELIGELR